MSDFIINDLTIFPFTKTEKETLFKESDVINSKIPFSYKKLGEVNIVNYLINEKDKFKDKFNIQEWIESLEFGFGDIVETTPESFDFIEKVKILEKETKMHFLGEILVETIPVENLIEFAFDSSRLKIQQPLKFELQNGNNFNVTQFALYLKQYLEKVEEHKDENDALNYLSFHFDICAMKETKSPFVEKLLNMLMIYEEVQLFKSQQALDEINKNSESKHFEDLELIDFSYKENTKRNEEHFVIYFNVKEILKQSSVMKKLFTYEKHYFVKTSKKKSHLKLV